MAAQSTASSSLFVVWHQCDLHISIVKCNCQVCGIARWGGQQWQPFFQNVWPSNETSFLSLEWLKNCLVQGFLIPGIHIFSLSETWHLSSICLYCLGQCACFSFHWVLVLTWRLPIKKLWLEKDCEPQVVVSCEGCNSHFPISNFQRSWLIFRQRKIYGWFRSITWSLCGNCLMGLFVGSWPTTGSFSPLGGILMCFRELPDFSSFLFQNP